MRCRSSKLHVADTRKFRRVDRKIPLPYGRTASGHILSFKCTRKRGIIVCRSDFMEQPSIHSNSVLSRIPNSKLGAHHSDSSDLTFKVRTSEPVSWSSE